MFIANLSRTEPSLSLRLVVTAISLIVYGAIFLLYYAVTATVPLPAYILPILAAGWGFGLRGALVIGVVAMPFNTLLMLLAGASLTAWLTLERIPGAVAGLLAGLVIGWLFDLQKRLTQQLAERERAEMGEREHHAFADVMRHIVTALNETLEPQQVFDRILESLDQVVVHDTARIVLVEHGEMRVARQKDTANVPELSTATIKKIVELAEDGAATVIPQLPPQAGSGDFQSAVVAPIRVEGQMIGFVILLSIQPSAFSIIHSERLQALADHAAIVIRNAQIYNALESNVIELETLYNATSFLMNAGSIADLGRQIVQAVAVNLDKGDCGLWLIDTDQDQIVCLSSIGEYPAKQSVLYFDETHPITEAINQAKVTYVPNFARDPRYALNPAGLGSELVIPLKGGSGVIGALDFHSLLVDDFSTRDQRILTAFAERAVIAIDNMRLYETIHQFAIDREQQVIERTSELNRAKERVEAILNSSSDTIILTLPDGLIQQSNRAFYTLFDYFFDEEFNWPLTRLMAPDSVEQVNDALHAARDVRRPQRLEVTAMRKDGTPFAADLVLSPIHERGGGGCWGIVCSLRDISERKRMEQELREALAKERELRELKSRFVSMASHEFRTPLATILATASLLRNYIDRMDETKKQRQFEKIEEQISYMTGLMNDVLTISRMEAGKTPVNFEPIYLHEFLEEMAEEFEQTQPAHQLDFRWDGEKIAIPIDSKLMREIVNNLLTNAAKYSPADSTVHLTLHYQPDEVAFIVRDEGIGIPESDQSHLFEAFHRADNVGTIPGTGLGLSIVKNAVEMHGGAITFESNVNIGTTFTVRIPVQVHEGIRT